MKICTRCGVEQPVANFAWQNKSKGRRQTRCRVCRSEIAKERWASGTETQKNYESKARRVKRAHDYLWSVFTSVPCTDCGNTDPFVLEFDHVSDDKQHNIAQMIASNYGLQSIKAEVAKCEVVCANCHRIRTSTRAKNWRYVRKINNQQISSV